MTCVLKKYSTRTQSVLLRFEVIFCKNCTAENILLDFPLFASLQNDLTFSPSIRRNLSRHVHLFSST